MPREKDKLNQTDKDAGKKRFTAQLVFFLRNKRFSLQKNESVTSEEKKVIVPEVEESMGYVFFLSFFSARALFWPHKLQENDVAL